MTTPDVALVAPGAAALPRELPHRLEQPIPLAVAEALLGQHERLLGQTCQRVDTCFAVIPSPEQIS
jgi:hypothetical protein